MRLSRNGKTVVVLLGMAGAMGGLVAASVPLYDLFCRVTGYGGTTRTAAEGSEHRIDRAVTVRFDASLNRDMPWTFEPKQRQMVVQLGENGLAWYTVRNETDQPIVGTATFNVAPAKAGPYFNKVDCFCFTEQRLDPGQEMDLPVTFFVDPALAADKNTADVGTITLSYTFFRAKNPRQGAAQQPIVIERSAPQADKREGRS